MIHLSTNTVVIREAVTLYLSVLDPVKCFFERIVLIFGDAFGRVRRQVHGSPFVEAIAHFLN